MKRNHLSENELRLRYITAFANEGDTIMQTEVPVFCRSVDLVVNDVNEEVLTAIEFKIHDWKRAIEQIQSVRFCFDYSCICMPKPVTDLAVEQLVAACMEKSIGLILYDIGENKFETHYSSPNKQMVWKTQKNRIISYLGDKE